MNRNVLRMAGVFSAALFLATALPTRAQEGSGPTATLHFAVVRDTDGKSVRNAQVVLHAVGSKGKQGRSDIELKTDTEGRTSLGDVSYGTWRVQVLAPHFKTFGEDYEINKPELEITVKLKHPSGQFSTYGDEKK